MSRTDWRQEQDLADLRSQVLSLRQDLETVSSERDCLAESNDGLRAELQATRGTLRTTIRRLDAVVAERDATSIHLTEALLTLATLRARADRLAEAGRGVYHGFGPGVYRPYEGDAWVDLESALAEYEAGR